MCRLASRSSAGGKSRTYIGGEILLVAAENFRAFGCDLWHVAVPHRGGPRDAIDELWEVEWLLHLPDFLMLIRREKPAGSPTATHPIGTVVWAGNLVRRWTTAFTRTSEL